MKTLFLSYHYDEPNTGLAKQVEQLVESHGLRAVTGDVLGGRRLTDEIKEQIAKADGLIALLTRSQPLPDGSWTTHLFCQSELQHARSLDGSVVGTSRRTYPAIALVENGVPTSGLVQDHEHIPFDSSRPLPAFLRLSETIAKWKHRAGRWLTLQVAPDDIVKEISSQGTSVAWEYRLWNGGDETEWLAAKPRVEPGGLFVWVRVPDDTMLIEIRARAQARAWQSAATPFHTRVTLAGRG